AGPGGGTIDTLIIDNRNEVYYYGGNANLRLANLFTLEHFPSRIVALQFNLHDPGAYSAEIRKVSGGSIGELVWQGGGYAGSSGWSEITVSDEVIVFGSSAFFPETSFAVAFKPSYDDQKLWASDNNSGRSFYWNGATWVSVPLTFMIRAIVERFGSLSIRETSSVAVDFKIYPNPFNEAFIVEFPYYEQGYLLDIFDITGKRRNSDVEVKGLNGYFYLKPVRMNSGIYFLKVKSGERVFTGKVIYLR
ncbi:MAG: T9SS type A sorting domain-containing protein, partial [bacterium]